MKKRAIFLVAVLTLLVPLGLLTDNPAWGEWDLDYYKKVLGFIPKGMEISIINPLIPDYELSNIGSIFSYYLSAVVGILIIFGIYFLIFKILKTKNG
jgi:hypothetical protein